MSTRPQKLSSHIEGMMPEYLTPTDGVSPQRRGQPAEDHDILEYPEGGTKAWLVVMGALCAMIPSMGLLNSLAVLQAWLSENQLNGMSESSIGWIFSTYAFFLFVCGAQVGPIFDTHDIRFLIIPGTIGIVLAVILFSISQHFYQFFLSFGVLGGISSSLLFSPSISAVGHWFSKRRGLATGIACTAGGFGGVWFPLIILYLAPRIGFGCAMRIIAAICAVHGFVACFLLRKRLPNKRGGASINFKALADLKYCTLAIGTVLIEFSIFVPITYICSYGIHSRLTYHDAYMLNTLFNAGAIPGRAIPGYIADRFGVLNTMCTTAFACMVLIFCVWLTVDGDRAMTIAFAVLFGFWSGASISLAPVCVGQVCRTEDYGTRSGTAYTLASVGTLLEIPLAGAVLGGNDGSYKNLIIFAGTSYLSAFIVYFMGRVLLGGWKVLSKL
ncbi:monocarboxylate permease-like protein, mch4 [Ilyonectria sp. MPI-CAGE-AT-0026]|nr:monocarboxylate permease-like protein, mch4 [Ilyonectria sp. MPI-CAGE-AT-0026]